MTIFFKTIAGVLLTLILGLVLTKQERDLWVLLTICACCMVFTVVLLFLQPIIDFFENLRVLANMDQQIFKILMKSVCIGLLAEITTLICTDSGNAALGKGIQILSVTMILWLGLPLLNELLELIQSILGVL